VLCYTVCLLISATRAKDVNQMSGGRYTRCSASSLNVQKDYYASDVVDAVLFAFPALEGGPHQALCCAFCVPL